MLVPLEFYKTNASKDELDAYISSVIILENFRLNGNQRDELKDFERTLTNLENFKIERLSEEERVRLVATLRPFEFFRINANIEDYKNFENLIFQIDANANVDEEHKNIHEHDMIYFKR